MGGVNVTLANGQLGATLQTNDGICGLVITGATEGGYTAGTAILVTGMSALATAGITGVGNAFANRHIQEFYDEVGEGAQLYVMLVPNTMTVAMMADHTNANGAKKLLDFAQGKIKVLGILADDKAVHGNGAILTQSLGAGGSGYAVNDTFTVNTGSTLATGKVLTVSSGAVVTFQILTGGGGYSVASGVATAATSGVGAGLTINILTVGTTITITNGMNADVYPAAANGAVLANDYFLAEKPFRVIIGGSSYAGTASALTDETSGTTNNRVCILIGDTQSYDATYSSAAVGLALGVIASIPVQRKISRVRNGALTNQAVYLHTTAIESAGGDPATIAGRGYITFKTYPNLSGYFFSGDPTLAATTDDYCMLARGRVMDKAHILAYATFVQEVDDEVPVNSDGTIDSGFAKWLEQQIVNQINNTMKANKEISAVSCFINPAQNILSTNTLNVVLKVTPVGYATTIDISLGFDNPANG